MGYYRYGYISDDHPSDILPIQPQGTNSTHFTACCGVAICNNEKVCPECGRNVIGWNAESDHVRGRIRDENATRHWRK